ncbi:hypothetical protein ACFYYY_15620 [Streptomyces sp. NPDC001834]|uniref:hypothetical protein n=1 Tax=Streptomyces sp. NPDC001834 TaxID=3364616 RepID=UPI0036CAE8C3
MIGTPPEEVHPDHVVEPMRTAQHEFKFLVQQGYWRSVTDGIGRHAEWLVPGTERVGGTYPRGLNSGKTAAQLAFDLAQLAASGLYLSASAQPLPGDAGWCREWH